MNYNPYVYGRRIFLDKKPKFLIGRGKTIMKKAMISQPMTDKTPEEIKTVKELAVRDLQSKGFEVVNSYFEDDWANPETMISRGVKNIPMAFIARSIEVMATCDAMYFCKDWEKSRGCKIEHEVAVAYGMEIIYE